jgi:N-acetyl-gamma-glutamyl-phosphate reductase common form
VSDAPKIPTLLLGGSGYVAGELLRILAGHPAFRVAAVVSGSRAAESVGDVFPHLRGTAVDGLALAGADAIERTLVPGSRVAVFSALPHGEAATRIDSLLGFAAGAGCELTVVDLSADFRHRPERYAEIYGRPHGAPERQADFLCALPEHAPPRRPRHVAHPGCFTTAATLALVPLVAGNWIEPRATVVAVTGSTGAGRTPSPTTHHPERRSDLFAYAPLAHRHEPEMRALVAAAAGKSQEPRLSFVPCSGPFARGIHATITATLARPASADAVRQALADAYAGSPFVRVGHLPPRLQSVVGSNRCELAVAVRGDELVLLAAIDNLVKGATGGAVQWMNRLFGLPEATGLALPGLGWL